MARELITFFSLACAWSWGFWSLGIDQTDAKTIATPSLWDHEGSSPLALFSWVVGLMAVTAAIAWLALRSPTIGSELSRESI